MWRIVLASLAVAGLLSGCMQADKPQTPVEEGDEWEFQVYHYDSRFNVNGSQPGEAQEVFRVHRVDPAFAPFVADLSFTDNAEPRAVTWEDSDGILGVGDRFWFFAEPADIRHELEGWLAGTKVMDCAYGGGAGQPLEPEDLEAAGILKCVETPQD